MTSHDFQPVEAETTWGIRTRFYCPRCGVSRADLNSTPAEPCLPSDATHRHRYSLVPVWAKGGDRIESWWWCTDHPAGEWARIEDDPEAGEAIPAADFEALERRRIFTIPEHMRPGGTE